jgi:hypothetical protein
MPSLSHEALLVLFRNRPELAPELLRDSLHVPLPAYSEVRLESSELTDVAPAEYRADLVILLVDGSPSSESSSRSSFNAITASGSHGRSTSRVFGLASPAPRACWS